MGPMQTASYRRLRIGAFCVRIRFGTQEVGLHARQAHQKLSPMSDTFNVRLATMADSQVIAWHRARMFQDMGYVPAELFDYFRAISDVRLREAPASGEYVGWLATEGKSLQNIVAGAGVQLRRVLPYPISEPGDKIRICDGRQGIILNVFTEPNWRRRGVAALLLKTIVAWSRKHGLDGLVLHASDEGRSLYEQLGFVSTNEVQREFGHRFQRRLGAASDHRALPRRLQHRSQPGQREQRLGKSGDTKRGTRAKAGSDSERTGSR